jgi:hypothetical protein
VSRAVQNPVCFPEKLLRKYLQISLQERGEEEKSLHSG